MDILNNKNLDSLVFKLSVPIFIELLLQMLVGNVDQIMISRYSQEGVGAIGNANLVFSIVIIILSVLSVSATVIMSKHLGAKNKQKLSDVFNASLIIISIFSIIITAVIFLFHGPIFSLMNIPEQIYAQTLNYLLIVGHLPLFRGCI